MLIENVKEIVEREYGLFITSIEKIKNVYKIVTDKEIYALKVINYNFPHFLFILSAIKHLQHNDFKQTPQIIKTKRDEDYIKLLDKYAYLNPWVECKHCDYDIKDEVRIATINLAKLHKKSRGFQVSSKMKARIGWGRWIDDFTKKRLDILEFKDIIQNKKQKSEFDNIYLNSIPKELSRIDRSIKHLKDSKYFEKMIEEIKFKGFCHHDYANHNVLLGSNGSVNIIDFDYCILDTHMHDLCSLIIRVMKNGKWNVKYAIDILNWYDSIYQIKTDDINIMSAFIEFPQDFWQRGIQYYKEKQPWGEDFFVKKINKINIDKDMKQDFVDEFRSINY